MLKLSGKDKRCGFLKKLRKGTKRLKEKKSKGGIHLLEWADVQARGRICEAQPALNEVNVFIVPFSNDTSSSISFSKGEGAVLHHAYNLFVLQLLVPILRNLH